MGLVQLPTIDDSMKDPRSRFSKVHRQRDFRQTRCFVGRSVFVSFMQFENPLNQTSDFPPDLFFAVEEKRISLFFLRNATRPPTPKKEVASYFSDICCRFCECFVCGNGVENQVFCPAERQYFLLYRKDCQVLGGRWRSPETNGAGYQWMREILAPSDWIPQDSIVLGCLVKLLAKNSWEYVFFGQHQNIPEPWTRGQTWGRLANALSKLRKAF